MDPWTVAKAFAKEPWSKAYFDRLRSAHQNHYEQFGDIKGVATVDGKDYKLDLNVMRQDSERETQELSNTLVCQLFTEITLMDQQGTGD